MVELSGIIDSDFLEKCENKCKILVSATTTNSKGASEIHKNKKEFWTCSKACWS